MAGQEPQGCEDAFTLVVEIRSTEGQAVVGASVVFPERQQRFLTDGAGRFSVTGVCPGSMEMSVAHLAYGSRNVVAEATAGERLVVEMAPQPIVLEGLTVSVETVIQQLERRREAFGYKSGVINTGDFSDEALPADLPAYVAARTGHPLTGCTDSETFGRRDCYPYRGRLRRIQGVCIDGTRSPHGPSGLDQVTQHADIARLEFYPSAGLVKVYTKAFVLLASEKPWLLADAADSC